MPFKWVLLNAVFCIFACDDSGELSGTPIKQDWGRTLEYSLVCSANQIIHNLCCENNYKRFNSPPYKKICNALLISFREINRLFFSSSLHQSCSVCLALLSSAFSSIHPFLSLSFSLLAKRVDYIVISRPDWFV